MVKGMPIYAVYSISQFGGYFPWMLLFTEVKNIVCYTEDVVINAFANPVSTTLLGHVTLMCYNYPRGTPIRKRWGCSSEILN